MTIKELSLPGVFEIQLEVWNDFRGFFMPTYDAEMFKTHGLTTAWVHEYHNLSLKKGTIRGLHFQLPPHAQTKMVRVIQGETLDVFVDLRKDSATFGQWGSVVVSAQKNNMVYVPKGFAHALCSLEDNTMVICKSDAIYAPQSEWQLAWSDPDLNIDWQLAGEPIVSEKDMKAKSFKEFIATAGGITI